MRSGVLLADRPSHRCAVVTEVRAGLPVSDSKRDQPKQRRQLGDGTN
jgi:hypothetical protein